MRHEYEAAIKWLASDDYEAAIKQRAMIMKLRILRINLNKSFDFNEERKQMRLLTLIHQR